MKGNDAANLLEVSVENGKYVIIQSKNGELGALRHGAIWRDLTGDNMVLAMAQKIANQQELIKKIENCAVCYVIEPDKTKLLMSILEMIEQNEFGIS